jgi:hypothetical protein
MTRYTVRVGAGWTFVFGVLLLPALLAVGATVLVFAGVVAGASRVGKRWPALGVLLIVAVLLAAVVIGASSYGR